MISTIIDFTDDKSDAPTNSSLGKEITIGSPNGVNCGTTTNGIPFSSIKSSIEIPSFGGLYE